MPSEPEDAKKNIFSILRPAADIREPIWLSVSETAKLGGVTDKTIRRAIDAGDLVYKIVGNRYYIDFSSALSFYCSTTKLYNKFMQKGLGQYLII